MQKTYRQDTVTICAPDIAMVQDAPVAADVAASRDRWLALARQGDSTIVYLSIYQHIDDAKQLVGQIFLHDYDPAQQESLIGYHLFQPEYRGQGIGTMRYNCLCSMCLRRLEFNAS